MMKNKTLFCLKEKSYILFVCYFESSFVSPMAKAWKGQIVSEWPDTGQKYDANCTGAKWKKNTSKKKNLADVPL